MMHKLTKAKKAARLIANGDAVAAIYDRGRPSSDLDGYLAINQPSDPLAVARIKEQAELRRRRRGSKRAAVWNGQVGVSCTVPLDKEGRCSAHES